jgi:hypothetical protein
MHKQQQHISLHMYKRDREVLEKTQLKAQLTQLVNTLQKAAAPCRLHWNRRLLQLTSGLQSLSDRFGDYLCGALLLPV